MGIDSELIALRKGEIPQSQLSTEALERLAEDERILRTLTPGAILSGEQIEIERRRGNIIIEPYDRQLLQPNSIDVRLGASLLAIKKTPEKFGLTVPFEPLDMKKDNSDRFTKIEIPPTGYVLDPDFFYLGHTHELVGTTDLFVPHVDGKSSVGRLGIKIHFTAGRGEVGFARQWTLEIETAVPVRIYAGIPFGQVAFYTVYGRIQQKYEGKYAGQNGATPSRYHQNFADGGPASDANNPLVSKMPESRSCNCPPDAEPPQTCGLWWCVNKHHP